MDGHSPNPTAGTVYRGVSLPSSRHADTRREFLCRSISTALIFRCPTRNKLGCANLYSLISHRHWLTDRKVFLGMACTPSKAKRVYLHRWVATDLPGQAVRRVQKNTLCPEGFRGRGVKRTGLRLELIDEVGHSHDVVDFGRGRGRGRATERRSAFASVVPPQFEAAQHILPEVILDRAGPCEDVA